MKRQLFSDFEKFRATNPQLDGQWLLNGGRDWRWSSESLAVGECQILRCYAHTGLVIEGVASNEGFGFYIPFKSGVWRNNGVGFNADDVTILEPGAEYCETSKTEDGWHCFFVPTQLLAIDTESRGDRARCAYSVHTQQTRTDTVCKLFQTLIDAVAKDPGIEFSPAALVVEAELQSLLVPLLECSADPDPKQGRPLIPRQEIIRRSRRVLEQFGNEPINVSQLSALGGVTERTLRRVYEEYYGIGPRHYLHLRQLHKVHRDLLDSDPDNTKVSDILTRWGVWELGRFSGRYKLQFGELPSETLHRRSQERSAPPALSRPNVSRISARVPHSGSIGSSSTGSPTR